MPFSEGLASEGSKDWPHRGTGRSRKGAQMVVVIATQGNLRENVQSEGPAASRGSPLGPLSPVSNLCSHLGGQVHLTAPHPVLLLQEKDSALLPLPVPILENYAAT